MTHAPIMNKSQLFAAAATIGAMGLFLTIPTPAQAAPACAQYGVAGGVTLTQSNGWNVSFNSPGPIFSGPANAVNPTTKAKLNAMQGTVSGGFTSGSHADFTITWNQGPVGHYTGDVAADGILRGNGVDEKTPSSTATYQSSPLRCETPAAAPAPAAPAPQPAPAQPAPAAATAPTAKVINDDDVYNITDGPGKHKIGTLQAGTQVQLVEPCSFDAFCHVDIPAGGSGFAWAPGLLQPGS
jgi:hypothetical protein